MRKPLHLLTNSHTFNWILVGDANFAQGSLDMQTVEFWHDHKGVRAFGGVFAELASSAVGPSFALSFAQLFDGEVIRLNCLIRCDKSVEGRDYEPGVFMPLCPCDSFLEERAGIEFSGWCFCSELGFRATDQNEVDRVWFDDAHLSSGCVLLIEKFAQSRGGPPIALMF